MRPRSLFEGGGISSIARTLDRPTSIPLTIKPRSIPADIPKTHFFGKISCILGLKLFRGLFGFMVSFPCLGFHFDVVYLHAAYHGKMFFLWYVQHFEVRMAWQGISRFPHGLVNDFFFFSKLHLVISGESESVHECRGQRSYPRGYHSVTVES